MLKLYSRYARLLVEKFEEAAPTIKITTVKDAKALLSEIRALYNLIRIETEGDGQSPKAAAGVKQDITLEELQERYAAAHAVPVQKIEPPREAYAAPAEASAVNGQDSGETT